MSDVPPPTNKLNFTSLDPECTNQELRELCCHLDGFESANAVRFTRDTCNGRYGIIGQCTSLGFVQFRTVNQAQRAADFFARAKEELGHGLYIRRKEVQVCMALPRGEEWMAKVFVRGIPSPWTSSEVKKCFQDRFGLVESVRLSRITDGASSRSGYVFFHQRASADDAVNSSGEETLAEDGRIVRFQIELYARPVAS